MNRVRFLLKATIAISILSLDYLSAMGVPVEETLQIPKLLHIFQFFDINYNPHYFCLSAFISNVYSFPVATSRTSVFCSSSLVLAISTTSSEYLIVLMIFAHTLKSPIPYRPSMTNHSPYMLSSVSDWLHPCQTPLPIRVLFVSALFTLIFTFCLIYKLFIKLLFLQLTPMSFRFPMGFVLPMNETCTYVFIDVQ